MMLTCREVAERASALIDGEIRWVGRLQLRFHLALCKGCGAFVSQMRTTRELMHSVAALKNRPPPMSMTAVPPSCRSLMAQRTGWPPQGLRQGF